MIKKKDLFHKIDEKQLLLDEEKKVSNDRYWQANEAKMNAAAANRERDEALKREKVLIDVLKSVTGGDGSGFIMWIDSISVQQSFHALPEIEIRGGLDSIVGDVLRNFGPGRYTLVKVQGS